MPKKYVPFSIRAGSRKIPQLGLRDMPESLRISLWNVIAPWLFEPRYADEFPRRVEWVYNFPGIQWAVHTAPTWHYRSRAIDQLHEWFMRTECDNIYDFMEALPQVIYLGMGVTAVSVTLLRGRSLEKYDYVVQLVAKYRGDVNAMLEREGSPLRFVNELLAPVTNETEIKEVMAAASGANDRYAPARAHIADSLGHLGSRPPVYADAIKQAVSAVESVLRIFLDGSKANMGQLLRAFEQRAGPLHPAMRDAMDKIYGYAGDENGVRHGAKGPVTVGEAEARVMLVVCSAFTNFLIRKIGEVGK